MKKSWILKLRHTTWKHYGISVMCKSGKTVYALKLKYIEILSKKKKYQGLIKIKSCLKIGSRVLLEISRIDTIDHKILTILTVVPCSIPMIMCDLLDASSCPKNVKPEK